MKIPETAKEAADFVAKMASKSGKSIAAYCQERGVSPSVITRWRKQYKSFNVSTFLRLKK